MAKRINDTTEEKKATETKKGRPKKFAEEPVRSSFVIAADVHAKLVRLARYKGFSLNDYIGQILKNFVAENSAILKILDDTDKKIAKLENKGGDDID